jgi:hypothetical protein
MIMMILNVFYRFLYNKKMSHNLLDVISVKNCIT